MNGTRRRLAAWLAVALAATGIVIPSSSAPLAQAGPVELFDTVRAADAGSDLSVYGHVVSDGRGTFHHVVRDDLPAQGIVYRQSRDGGRTFAILRRFSGDSGGGTRPKIAVSGDHVAIAYIGASCVGTVCDELAYLVESTDRGSTWTAPRRLLDDGVSSVQVAVDGARTWLLVQPYGRPIELRGTVDGGASWFVSRSYVGGAGGLLDARDGTMVAAWFTGSSSPKWQVASAAGSIYREPAALPGVRWIEEVATGDGVGYLLETTYPGLGVRAADLRDLGEFGQPVQLTTTRTFGEDIDAARGNVAVSWLDVDSNVAMVATSSTGGDEFSAPVVLGPAESTHVGLTEIPTDDPIARFDWTVPSRYVDRNGDGIADPANSNAGAGFDVARSTIDVSLDGCASLPSAGQEIVSWKWTIGGEEVSGTDKCSVRATVNEGVPVEVTLTVTDDAGQGRAATTTSAVTPNDFLVVSIGDSIASGEGVPDRTTGQGGELWGDHACHRSSLAGPALAAQQLEAANRQSSVTFVQLACSGAAVVDTPDVAVPPATPDETVPPAKPDEYGGLLDTYIGVEPQPSDVADPSQLDQLAALKGTRQVDALMLSTGANDLRFSATVKDCIISPPLMTPCTRSGTRTQSDLRMQDLPRRYGLLATRFGEMKIDQSRVFITEYPDPTTDQYGLPNLRCVVNRDVRMTLEGGKPWLAPLSGLYPLTQGLEFLGLITDEEAAWAHGELLTDLNGAVAEAAALHEWHYVGGITAASQGHGYCSNDPWTVDLFSSFRDQFDEFGAFHPNVAGHRSMARAIFRAVRQLLLESPAVDTDAVPTDRQSIGDIYVTLQRNAEVRVVALRDTGSTPVPVLARTIDRSLDPSDAMVAAIGPVAADRTAAVITWTQLWNNIQSYATKTAQVALSENIAVRRVRIVQAPDDSRYLVVGKSTVVMATVDAAVVAPVTVDVTTEVRGFDGTVVGRWTEPTQIVPGLQELVVPRAAFLPTPAIGLEATVTVQDPSTAFAASTGDNDATSTDGGAPMSEPETTRAVSIVFVPVSTTTGASSSCADAAAAASRYRRTFQATQPVADDQFRFQLGCTPFADVAPGARGVTEAIARLDAVGKMAGVDVVVGVVPRGFLRDSVNGAVGLAMEGRSGMLVEPDATAAVLSHEFGHYLGLDHPLVGADPVPSAGVQMPARRIRSGGDLMYFREQQRFWISGANWQALMDALQDPARTPSPPAASSGLVYVQGTVHFDGQEYRATTGRWVPAGPGAVPVSGPGMLQDVMTLHQFDGAGDPVGTPVPVPLSPLHSLGETEGESSTDFGFGIPTTIDPRTARVEFRIGGSPVLSRPVSTFAPTARVVAPTAGSANAGAQPLTIQWEMGDPDGPGGGNLSADVFLSGDGGANWVPVAYQQTGSSASVTVPGAVRGDAVVARVIVSDGVRSAIADSAPFSVNDVLRGPAEVVYQKVGRGIGCGNVDIVACSFGLAVMAPDGSAERMLVANTEGGAAPGTNVFRPSQPTWSPDGTQVAFQAQAYHPGFPPGPGEILAPEVRNDIFVVAADGTGLRRVSQSMLEPGQTSRDYRLEFSCPSWSPDGTKLSFVSDRFPNRYIVVANADGTGQRVVGQYPKFYVTPCPEWSPDGAELAVAGDMVRSNVPPWGEVLAPVLPTYIEHAYVIAFDVNGPPSQVGVTVGAVLREGRISGILNGLGVSDLRWTSDGDFLVGITGWPHCGIVRLPRNGVQDRLFNCPNVEISPTQGRIGNFRPVSAEYISDSVIAFTSGHYFQGKGSTFGVFDGFDPAFCTVPDAGKIDPPTSSDSDPRTPGLSCVTPGGVAADVPPVGRSVTGRSYDYSPGAVVSTSSSGVVIPDEPPTIRADAGGPYTAEQFEPVQLDAGASALLSGERGGEALVEWDLDQDGVFDEAIGPRPIVHFDVAGRRTIAVRISVPGGPPVVSAGVEVAVSAGAVVLPVPAPGSASVSRIDLTPIGGTIDLVDDGPVEFQLATEEGVATAFEIIVAPPSSAGLLRAGVPGPDATRTGSDGRITFTPTAGFTGSTSFTFRVAGQKGGGTATMVLRRAVNAPPIAQADRISVVVGSETAVATALLVANDVDPDAADRASVAGLTVVNVTGYDGGTAWLDPNGGIRVFATRSGTATFRYAVADAEGGVATAIVTVDAAGDSLQPTTAPPMVVTAPVTPTDPARGLRFEPVRPARLVDTRSSTQVPAGGTLRVDVAGRGGVPVDAGAVALSVIAVDAMRPGFLTVWPCGIERPLASNVNYVAGEIVANAVTVGIGGDGAVCIFSMSATDVVVDVNGYWSATGTAAFSPVTPTRVIDTRVGRRVGRSSITAVDVSGVVPPGASAVAVNLTAVAASADGFLTVFPCGSTVPMASNLNVPAEGTVAVSVLAGRGVDGTVCVYSSVATDVIVDVTGWFGSAGAATLRAEVPTRLLDTRIAPGAMAEAGSVTRVAVPANATGVVLNITAIDALAPGYVTVHACNEARPWASNLNVDVGRTRANQVMIGAGIGTVCIYSQAATHLVVDRTGTLVDDG